MKAIGILVSFLFISGCTTLQKNGGGVEEVLIDYPAIGIETTALVGEEMLSKGSQTTVNAINLKQSVSVGLTSGYTFSPGIYTQVGHSEGKIFYSPVNYGMVQRFFLADPYGGMYIDHKEKELCGVSVFGGTVCADADYEVTKHTRNDMLSFQQTLLYSGKIGNKINISYREFSNNKARPAFSNDVEYDLSDNNVIGYKGALLEILNANNLSIKYKVLRNFR